MRPFDEEWTASLKVEGMKNDIGGVIKITNPSRYKVIFSEIPQKPKRTVYPKFFIAPKSYKIFEHFFDITNYYITFVK